MSAGERPAIAAWFRRNVTTPAEREAFAAAMDVDLGHVDRWLAGSWGPSPRRSPAIAEHFGVDAETILRLIEGRP